MASSGIHTLLACDLDGTVAPVRPDPAFPALVAEFRTLLAAAPGTALAYLTGRSAASAETLIADLDLPLPVLLAADVGTRIILFEGGARREDEAYSVRMRRAMGGSTGAGILELLADVEGLDPQRPDDRQGMFKASFFLPSGAAGDAVERDARAALAAAGITASLVRSECVFEDRDLLDVLPAGVTKATAAARAAEVSGLSAAAVVYAGDSGNDLAPLLAAGRAIVVGNAPPGLRRAVLAKRDPRTTWAAAGEHLAGVLEGCRRFGIGSDL